MNRSRLCIPLALSLLAGTVAAQHAAAAQDTAPPQEADRRVLIDRDLDRKPIRLISLETAEGDGGMIVYDDAAGLRRRERLTGYLAIVDPLAEIERATDITATSARPA